MKYPEYNERARETVMQNVFGGYNRSAGASETEFLDMGNMSSKRYPYLSPRYGRGKPLFDRALDITGMTSAWGPSGEYLILTYASAAGKQTFIRIFPAENEMAMVDIGMNSSAIPKHTFVTMGAYTVMFPEKLIIKLDSSGYPTFEPLENTTSVKDSVPPDFGDCGYAMVDISTNEEEGGNLLAYDEDTWRAKEPPEDPSNGELWLDTSNRSADPYGGGTGVVKCYSAAQKTFFDLYPTYVRFRYPGIGKGFSKGDRVSIELPEIPGPAASIRGDRTIVLCGDDFIVVEGIIEYSEISKNTVNPFHVGLTFKRLVPDMDFVIESGNRLWGCKNGMVDGEWLNEIYVSALGDPKNWNKYEGIASDSYAVSIGKQGAFTGAITYNDIPHFFKERCVIKVYGNAPSNYETVAIPLDGIEEGSESSVSVVDGAVYYKSRRGVMAFSGNSATLISREFGDKTYRNAVAGELDGKYYVCLENDGTYDTFVYDPWRGLWHREDSEKVDAFVRTERRLYASYGGVLRSVTGDDNDFEWYAESTPIGLDDPDYKYISRVRLRAYIPEGASLYVSYAVGDGAPFMELDSFHGGGLCTRLSVPIPDRCDHIRLRYSGKGDVDIYSVAYEYERGSDV